MNEVGEEIWRSIDGSITIKDIIENIISKFEVDKETVQRDVVKFINKLCEMKLVVL